MSSITPTNQGHGALSAIAVAGNQAFSSLQAVNDFVGRVCGIISDGNSYRRSLLDCDDAQAQSIINVLHRILHDHPSLDLAQQTRLRKALLQLEISRSSNLPPIFPQLPEIVEALRLCETPNVDIYRGVCQGRIIGLKKYRGYRLKPEDVIKLVNREVALRSTHHAGIVPVLGIVRHVEGPLDPGFYLVSPFPTHGTVISYLVACPESNRCLLLRDVICALSYLHSIHIIHGNVRGANVLVTASGRACIADLDLSDMCVEDDPTWTRNTSEVSLGTAPWKAPELLSALQFIGGVEPRPTQATDIYAFAGLAYEIFVEKAPFWHILPHAHSLARLHCIIEAVVSFDERPVRPSDGAHDLTAAVWVMMEECWSRDPLRRPSASDLSMLSVFTNLVDARLVSVE